MSTNRRDFFQTLGVGTLGLTVGSVGLPSLVSCSDENKKAVAEESGPVIQIGDKIAIVETTYGKVKGFILRGIYNFRGIPYGANTTGKNRFLPPQKPEPWTGMFPAVWWGNSAPQIMENRYENSYQSFVDHWNYDDVSENCLKLNIWTQAINDGKKRPVLLWLHGGGFTNGNGIEQDGYSGENFTRLGDVVFCSLNHRLGPLGFTNLAGVGGEKYAASGNVGMLDIVAALEWVHDNIANFGGDRDNVTIMGQSGGGAKVCLLTSMPSAKGLFHKSVVLSGAMTRAGDKEYSEKLGSYVLKEAELTPSQIDKLQDIAWKDYYMLATKAAQKLSVESGQGGGMMRRGFNPVVDGYYVSQDPYYPEAAPTAADVPMIISSMMNEISPDRDDPSLENITLNEVKEKVKVRAGFSVGFGDKAGEVVDAYVKAFPDKRPIEIWSMLMSNRKSAVDLADAKSKQKAPVYVDWFCWQPPLFDGRMRAFHCLDISFWFYNTDVMITHSGGGSRPKKLSTKMAGSLLQFMKMGNPNNGGLPEWPKYTSENGETMVLDDHSEVKNDPDREARNSISDSDG
jgi:para-nitrobenzyl esterase